MNDETRAALVDRAELADRIAALIAIRTQWSPLDRALEIIDTVLAASGPEPHPDLTTAYMAGLAKGEDWLDAALDGIAPNPHCKPFISEMAQGIASDWYVKISEDWISTYEGTGPTRTAAVLDAIDSAKQEGAGDE